MKSWRTAGQRCRRGSTRLSRVVTLFALGNSSDMFLLLYAQTKFGMSLAALIGLWIVPASLEDRVQFSGRHCRTGWGGGR